MIKIKLLSENAQPTVTNFVELAEGTKEFANPKTDKKREKRFYDGLIFTELYMTHDTKRDPLETATDVLGYKFQDKVEPF